MRTLKYRMLYESAKSSTDTVKIRRRFFRSLRLRTTGSGFWEYEWSPVSGAEWALCLRSAANMATFGAFPWLGCRVLTMILWSSFLVTLTKRYGDWVESSCMEKIQAGNREHGRSEHDAIHASDCVERFERDDRRYGHTTRGSQWKVASWLGWYRLLPETLTQEWIFFVGEYVIQRVKWTSISTYTYCD